jgi:NAD+ synthase
LNRQIIGELVKIDYDLIQKKVGIFLKNEIKKRRANGVVFGLSGGIDSAVMGALCKKFIKKKSLALIMPNSKITPEKETEDAINLVDNYSIEYKLIDIGNIHKEYSKYLEPNSLAFANLGARIRANMLYYHANAQNSLVLGSSDRSEFLIGYFTKFGDGASDLLPIVSIYKTQIRELAKSLGIPPHIISKPSGPHLWEGHTAETELGISYEVIDSILHCTIDKNLSVEETSKIAEIPISDVDRIFKMHINSEHKRALATSCIL